MSDFSLGMAEFGTQDLNTERSKAKFDVELLTLYLSGSRDVVELRRKFRAIVANDTILQKQNFSMNLSRLERVEHNYEIHARLLHYRRTLNLTDEHPSNPDLSSWNLFLSEARPLGSGLVLHEIAFTPFLRSQLADWQLQPWLSLAEEYRILGCYAQTELGHGSNVRGLETTATFIAESDEIEMHSPTLTSLKWWPGNLGCTSNFAVVMANLIVSGENLGIHSFLVQIRDLETHQPVPGVQVGDIGPKMGTAGIDNGFLRFSHVRIPRSQMMMRFQQLDRNGNYTKAAHEKLAYTGMISVRAGIVRGSFYTLSRALTVAVRYSCVRRQFAPFGGREIPVLDYSMQQYRLLPYLATAFALHFTGNYTTKLYEDMQRELVKGNMAALNNLAEVHASCAALKGTTTELACDGIEVARRCCGGHGYLLNSGIAELLVSYVGVVTAEGENYLLTQQASRYLLKMFNRAQQGKPLSGLVASLFDDIDGTLADRLPDSLSRKAFLCPKMQLRLYRHRVVRMCFDATNALQKMLMENNGSLEHVAVRGQVPLAHLSRAFSMFLLLHNFVDALRSLASSDRFAPLSPVLESARNLFALHWLQKDIGDFLQDGFLQRAHCELIDEINRELLLEIRSQAVPLVDSFDISDFALQSAIGAADGRAYERLYELARNDPLSSVNHGAKLRKHFGNSLVSKL